MQKAIVLYWPGTSSSLSKILCKKELQELTVHLTCSKASTNMSRAECLPLLSPESCNCSVLVQQDPIQTPVQHPHVLHETCRRNLHEYRSSHIYLYVFACSLAGKFKSRNGKWLILTSATALHLLRTGIWTHTIFLVIGQRAREFLCDFPKPTHFLKIAAQFVSLARGALHYNGIVGKVHLYAATS